MVDLTARETEAALWCIHTVALAYSTEPPDGSVLDGLKRKLLAQPHLAARKGAGIPAPTVVVEGKGW